MPGGSEPIPPPLERLDQQKTGSCGDVVQARYPSDVADTYRPEVVEFLGSLRIPDRDVFSSKC